MDKGWQDWTQWIGACILIPVIGLVAWKVFNNSERLAAVEYGQKVDHAMLAEIRDDIKEMRRYLFSLEPAE